MSGLHGLVPTLVSNDVMDDDLDALDIDDTIATLATMEEENKPEEEKLRPVRAIKQQSLNPFSAKHILLPLGQTSLRPPPPPPAADDTPPTPPPSPPPVLKALEEPTMDPEPRPLIANIGGFPHKLAVRPLPPPRSKHIRANESPATHWLDSMERERQQAKGPLFLKGGQSSGAPPCGCGGGVPPLDLAPPPRAPEPFVPPILPPAQAPPKCCAKGGRSMFYPSHQAAYYTGPGALRSNLSSTMLRTMLPITATARTDPLPASLRPPCCPPLAVRPPWQCAQCPCVPYCPDAPQPPPAVQPQCSPQCPPPTFRPARGPPCGPRPN